MRAHDFARRPPQQTEHDQAPGANAEYSSALYERCFGIRQVWSGCKNRSMPHSRPSFLSGSLMHFHHTSIIGLSHIDAPHRKTSSEINQSLRPAFDKFSMHTNVLEDIAGIKARRLWDNGTRASDVAIAAGKLALNDAGIQATQLGLVLNTSVSRDYLEPSMASIVAGGLGVQSTCQNFDIANACLAFVNGMDTAARMIDHGEIDYALIVDGETAEPVYEYTVRRLLEEGATADQVRSEMAALTLGSGAAAMVLCHSRLAPNAPRYVGSVSRSATQWNALCRGNIDRMETDTRGLLVEGVKLAMETLEAAKKELGWDIAQFSEFAVHQVSRVHTLAMAENAGIDLSKIMTIFEEHGNIGPASIPIVLSKLRDAGRLRAGEHIALLGIGSGLNCTMGHIVW